MRILVRSRILLWVAALTTLPPALLDLAEWLGFKLHFSMPAAILDLFAPYWLARAVIGVPSHGPSPGPQTVAAVLLGAFPFLTLHAYLAHKVTRRDASAVRAV
jgi:hypothetical protein